MKLKTINVVEYADCSLLGVVAFSADEDGIKEAEEHYKRVVCEHGDNITVEEMAVFIEDGYFENGDYQVFLSHSL